LDKIQKKIISLKRKRLKNTFSEYLSYCYNPSIGFVSVCIVHYESIEDYKSEKCTLHIIAQSKREDVLKELIKFGERKLTIELKPFMQDVLADIKS
ncbi:MAG: hypothetical protein PHI90_09720, partial [Clostridia bacterium]|nr:hypothetical protein [Clostridia bacterium]